MERLFWAFDRLPVAPCCGCAPEPPTPGLGRARSGVPGTPARADACCCCKSPRAGEDALASSESERGTVMCAAWSGGGSSSFSNGAALAAVMVATDGAPLTGRMVAATDTRRESALDVPVPAGRRRAELVGVTSSRRSSCSSGSSVTGAGRSRASRSSASFMYCSAAEMLGLGTNDARACCCPTPRSDVSSGMAPTVAERSRSGFGGGAGGVGDMGVGVFLRPKTCSVAVCSLPSDGPVFARTWPPHRAARWATLSPVSELDDNSSPLVVASNAAADDMLSPFRFLRRAASARFIRPCGWCSASNGTTFAGGGGALTGEAAEDPDESDAVAGLSERPP